MHLSHFINTSSLLSKCLGYPCMGWIKCEHFSFLLFISNIKVSGDFGKVATLFYFIFAWFLKNVINSMLKSKKAYPIEVSNPSQTVFLGGKGKQRTSYFGINQIKCFTLHVKQSPYSNVSHASTMEGHSLMTHSGSLSWLFGGFPTWGRQRLMSDEWSSFQLSEAGGGVGGVGIARRKSV